MTDNSNATGKKHRARDPKKAGSQTGQAGSISRRALLKGGGVAVAVAGTAGVITPDAAHAVQSTQSNSIKNPGKRRKEAVRIRERAARSYLKGRLPNQIDNGDEDRYSDYRASFFKTLPQKPPRRSRSRRLQRFSQSLGDWQAARFQRHSP